MSFINSNTVIDAILTKKGREKLANGTFNVSKFALSDDEVDYGMLSIPDGDNAILGTKILEASSLGQESNTQLKYKLIIDPTMNLTKLSRWAINPIGTVIDVTVGGLYAEFEINSDSSTTFNGTEVFYVTNNDGANLAITTYKVKANNKSAISLRMPQDVYNVYDSYYGAIDSPNVLDVEFNDGSEKIRAYYEPDEKCFKFAVFYIGTNSAKLNTSLDVSGLGTSQSINISIMV